MAKAKHPEISDIERAEFESMMKSEEEKIERLHICLNAKNVPIKGRGKALVEKTGYSQGMISRYLSGKGPLSERFISTVCMNYGISEEFIHTGQGDMLAEDIAIPNKTIDEKNIINDVMAIFNSTIFRMLIGMTDSEVLRFYADLLECSKIQFINKKGSSAVYEIPGNEKN